MQCGKIKDFSTTVMWTNLNKHHIWRNLRFVHICHAEKFEITPHLFDSSFFLKKLYFCTNFKEEALFCQVREENVRLLTTVIIDYIEVKSYSYSFRDIANRNQNPNLLQRVAIFDNFPGQACSRFWKAEGCLQKDL